MNPHQHPAFLNRELTGSPGFSLQPFRLCWLVLVILAGFTWGEGAWAMPGGARGISVQVVGDFDSPQSAGTPSTSQTSAKSDLQTLEKVTQPEKRYDGFQSFLQKYPQAEEARFAREQLNSARFTLVFEYRDAGKLEDAFRVGAEFIKEQPEFKKNEDELMVCITLGEEAGRMSLKGNFQHLSAGELFARQAISLMEGNQKIQLSITDWETSKGRYLSQMYQTIGVSNFKDRKFDDAVLSLSRSIDLNCRDPFSYYLTSLVYQEQYFEAATQFNAISDKQSSDARLALAKARASAAKAAEFMAKTIVVCESCMTAGDKESPTYGKLLTSCRTDIEDPYRVSHNNKLDGLDGYIQAMRARICSK